MEVPRKVAREHSARKETYQGKERRKKAVLREATP
jgi:hypothetical protein